MKRLASLFVALCLAVAGASAGSPADSSVKVIRVRFADNDKRVTEIDGAMGTGTVVASREGRSFVLTCWHVCPSGRGFVFVRVGEVDYPAEWLGADETADLAMLRVRAVLPAVAVADKGPKAGDELRQWGYTKGGPANPKTGKVEEWGRATIDGWEYDVMIARVPADFGDSGSGVFDAAGKLAGVCSAKSEDSRGPVELVVPWDDVSRFVGGWGDP
jgi:S1-C subfamily serine protease